MKTLAISEKYGRARYIAHQAYYSLIGREYEWELMPLALDQGVGTVVWSPLGMGRLGGKVRRSQALPEESRLQDPNTVKVAPPAEDEFIYRIVDVLDQIAEETGKTVAQVALNWVAQRPSVSTILIGARNEEQLRQNIDAIGWNLTEEQIARLDTVSERQKTYPYWHQAQFTERIRFPTG